MTGDERGSVTPHSVALVAPWAAPGDPTAMSWLAVAAVTWVVGRPPQRVAGVRVWWDVPPQQA